MCICDACNIYVYYTHTHTYQNSSPLSKKNMFQDTHWMPETTDSTKPHINYVFFLYMHTYEKV